MMPESLVSQSTLSKWLDNRLPLLGHRNWIVIADAAYPQQTSAGIETVVADAEQIDIVRVVLETISASGHVRANIYTDLELNLVSEEDAPGVTAYREELNRLLKSVDAKQIMHEEIIARLDERARAFRVLIIKTKMTIPYTSVFCELECGYWNAKAEARLRQAMHCASGGANAASATQTNHDGN